MLIAHLKVKYFVAAGYSRGGRGMGGPRAEERMGGSGATRGGGYAAAVRGGGDRGGEIVVENCHRFISNAQDFTGRR